MCSETPSKTSFAYYDPNNKSLKVSYKNRNLADVLRSIAHEIVHYKQDLLGILHEKSGITGSKHENQANSLAGILMRNWAKKDPTIFKTLLSESNSGIQSNEKYSKIKELIKQEVIQVLKILPQNESFYNLKKKNKQYSDIIDGEVGLKVKVIDRVVNFYIVVEFVDNLKLTDDNFISGMYYGKGNSIYLKIKAYNPESKIFKDDMSAMVIGGKNYSKFLNLTPRDVISSKTLEKVTDHETVHYFNDKINKVDHSNVKPQDINSKYKYLSEPEEILAYTAQLVNDIKNSHEKTLEDFLKKSSWWLEYEKEVFPKNPKIRSKMLSKLANAWNAK